VVFNNNNNNNNNRLRLEARVVGFTTGSEGEVSGKKENLCQEYYQLYLRTMDIRHFFAKRNGPEVLEQGPSISKEFGKISCKET
jgi:hypothetical protein